MDSLRIVINIMQNTERDILALLLFVFSKEQVAHATALKSPDLKGAASQAEYETILRVIDLLLAVFPFRYFHQWLKIFSGSFKCKTIRAVGNHQVFYRKRNIIP